MKRTIYMFIGLFIALLCVRVGGMLVISCLGKPKPPLLKQLDLQGKQIMKEVPDCRVIWISQAETNIEERSVFIEDSRLEVLPATGEKTAFSCSEKVEDYLKMRVMGDTLKILLDCSLNRLPHEFRDVKSVQMNPGDMRLNLAKKVECVINDIDHQQMVFKNLVKDSLAVHASDFLTVDSCDFRALHILKCGGREFYYTSITPHFHKGNINNLYVNLKDREKWAANVEKCRIGAEYFRGSGSVELKKEECKRVFYIPENENSDLTVTLKGKACVTAIE